MKGQPLFTEEQIRASLAREGSIVKTAKALQVSRPTLYRYLEHYRIDTERRTKAA